MSTSSDFHLPKQQVTTLLVSPLHSDHASFKHIFSRSNWNLQSAFNCQEALALLRCEPISVVICNPELPDGSWRLLLENTGTIPAPPRVIVASSEANEHLWADVLQLGGYDLLAKPWEAREVLRVIALAWRSWEFARRAGYPAAPRLAAMTHA